MGRWLVKEEPARYGFGDLLRDRKILWEGIKNPLARQHLRAMKKGDPVLYYHTGDEKAVVGVARVAAAPRPDPGAEDAAAVVVEIEAVRRLPAPVFLSDIKECGKFGDFFLVRLPRLSVMPVTDAQWKAIEAMARG